MLNAALMLPLVMNIFRKFGIMLNAHKIKRARNRKIAMATCVAEIAKKTQLEFIKDFTY